MNTSVIVFQWANSTAVEAEARSHTAITVLNADLSTYVHAIAIVTLICSKTIHTNIADVYI